MNSQKPELLPCPFCGEQVDPPKSRPSSRDKSEGFVAFLACYCGGYSANAHRMGQGETEKDAIQDVIAKWNSRAVQPSGVVHDGYVLVPGRIELSPADIAAIMIQCGGADDEADSFEDQFNGGVLWFGAVVDDDGNKTHGMHIACVECMEEGSATLAEFVPAPAQGPQVEPLHITHRPLIRNAINLLGVRRPVAPDVASVIEDLEAMLAGVPTPAEPVADHWLGVARQAEQSPAAEVLRDAERYRWLRDKASMPAVLCSDSRVEKYFNEYMICGEQMDKAIDQARGVDEKRDGGGV